MHRSSLAGRCLKLSCASRWTSVTAASVLRPVRSSRFPQQHKAVSAVHAGQNLSNPVLAREQERSRAAISLFRVAGVSFQGRQEHLARLREGSAVMFVKEPENIHDQHAVAVKLLDGTSLGYVPREQTPYFSRPVDFGHVRSVGLAQGTQPGIYGMQIVYQYTLAPLVAPAIPYRLNKRISLALERLHSFHDIQQQAKGRCQISGSQCGKDLVVSPTWQVDGAKHLFVLAGLLSIAPQLERAQRLLLEGDQEAAWTFQAMNGWTSEELQAYRAHQKQVLEDRHKEKAWDIYIDPKTTL